MGIIGTLPGERLAGLFADLSHKLQKGAITLNELALFTQRKNPFASDFTVEVDYEESLRIMIGKGNYDWVNSDIAARDFPIESEAEGGSLVQRPVFLRDYNRPMQLADVLTVMEEAGEEPAPIEDLLAFGAKYPDEQLKYQIVALGSSTGEHDGRRVPYLSKNGTKRGLELYRTARGWHGNFRFLVREKAYDPVTMGLHGPL